MNLNGRLYSDLEEVILFDDTNSYYIAINRQTSDGIVNQLQDALDSMKEDGAYQKIERHYLR